MNTENIYQIIDDLEGFAQQIGSEWMKERLAMLEAHLAQLENNQTLKLQNWASSGRIRLASSKK